jgi:hypothetical protein
MSPTKNEIQEIFNKYDVSSEILGSNSEELIRISRSLRNCENSERPDSIINLYDICYGIEHFEVSMYRRIKKQDVNKAAEGRKKFRDKLDDNLKYELKPSLQNLIDSISINLTSHSSSFIDYLSNLSNRYPDKEHKLLLFIEDTSTPSSILDENEQYIHPLEIDKIAEIFLAYKNDIYAVIYCAGNETHKQLYIISLDEIEKQLTEGNLHNINKCRLQVYRSSVTVGKTPENDNITARADLRDNLGVNLRETISIKRINKSTGAEEDIDEI